MVSLSCIVQNKAQRRLRGQCCPDLVQGSTEVGFHWGIKQTIKEANSDRDRDPIVSAIELP